MEIDCALLEPPKDESGMEVKLHLGSGVFGCCNKMFYRGNPVAVKTFYSATARGQTGGKSHVKVQTCKFSSSYWDVYSFKALPSGVVLLPCFGQALHIVFGTEEQKFEPFAGYLADLDQSVGSGNILFT